jgi:hypothetical protein
VVPVLVAPKTIFSAGARALYVISPITTLHCAGKLSRQKALFTAPLKNLNIWLGEQLKKIPWILKIPRLDTQDVFHFSLSETAS